MSYALQCKKKSSFRQHSELRLVFGAPRRLCASIQRLFHLANSSVGVKRHGWKLSSDITAVIVQLGGLYQVRALGWLVLPLETQDDPRRQEVFAVHLYGSPNFTTFHQYYKSRIICQHTVNMILSHTWPPIFSTNFTVIVMSL